MSIDIYLPDIADAIANIEVAGVTFRTYSGVAASWTSLPNVLYPNPEGYISGFSLDYVTLLQGATAPVDAVYTLNYRFLGSQIGDLSNMPNEYKNLIENVTKILNAIIGTDAPYSGKVEMKVGSVSVGARVDPAGNGYHGADFGLNIREMQNT